MTSSPIQSDNPPLPNGFRAVPAPAAVPDALTDADRLRALSQYDLDNPLLREQLDAITADTRARLGLPMSMVSLVLDSAQLFLGSSGVEGWMLAAGGTPVEWAFCAQVVTSGRSYIVDDAVHDSVQHTNPLVTVEGFGAYAGVPLVTPEGKVLGAHCAVDTAAHTFTPEDVLVLQGAAVEVMAVLEEFRN